MPFRIKTLWVIFQAMLLLSVLMLLFFIFLVWHGEHERKVLIDSYHLPAKLLKEITSPGLKPVRNLMKDGETSVCAINSYAGVEKIEFLNSAQKKSLPKHMLPSQDLSWYLLFFSHTRISRIFLVGTDELAGTTISSPICIDSGAYYEAVNASRNGFGVVELNLIGR